MKTTDEVLNDVFKDKFTQCFYNILIDFKYEDDVLSGDAIEICVKKAMIAYAEHIRDEDRKIVAENACIEKRTFYMNGSEEYLSTIDIEFDTRHHRFLIDKSSILNAPKLELK